MARRAFTVALSILLSPITVAAQGDSTTEHTKRRAPSGAETIALDGALIADAKGLTLAQFLGTRVPGLRLEYVSGYSRATPKVVALGAVGMVGTASPLLVVDGVVVPEDLRIAVGNAGQYAPSIGWGLLMDEIAAIRVALGASAGEGILGAARGAIYIETKHGRGAERGVEASMVHRTLSPELFGSANEGTLGFPSVPWYCTRYRQALGSCTAGARVSFNPAVALERLRSGATFESRVAVNRAIGEMPLRASAHSTTTSGIFPSDDLDRADFSLSFGSALTAATKWDASVWHSRLNGRDAGWDTDAPPTWMVNVGPLDSDSARIELANHYDWRIGTAIPDVSSRTHFSLRGSRVLSPSLSLRGIAGISHGDRTGYWAHELPSISAEEWRAMESRNEQLSLSVDHALEPQAGFTLESTAELQWLRMHQVERTRGVSYWIIAGLPTSPSTSSSSAGGELDLTQLHLRTRLSRGDWMSIGIGLRRLMPIGDAPNISLPSGDLAARLPVSTGLSEWFSDVVVRAAYGEDLDLRLPFDALQIPAFIEPDHTIERVFSFSTKIRNRAQLTLIRSRTTVTDATIGTPVPFGPIVMGVNNGWTIDAGALALAINSRTESERSWHAELMATHRAPVVSHLRTLPYRSGDQFNQTMTRWANGGTMGNIFGTAYTYADVNNDGIIVPTEVTPGNEYEIGPTVAPWVVTLRGDIAPVSGFRLGAVLESRRGNVAMDGASYMRCLYSECLALHEAGVPLAQQAAAVAADAYGISTAFVHRADFVKLREVWLELPTGRVPGVSGTLSIRIIGTNLATWTKFPSGDPEVGARRNGVPVGFLLRNPALPRTITLRIDIGG